MRLASLLTSTLVLPGFGVLPIITYFDATTLSIPPIVFYGVWFAFSLWLGLLVILTIAKKSDTGALSFFALFSVVLSACIITPLSLPGNVIDNFPSTPQTIELTKFVLSNGTLPSTTQSGISYLNYPAGIFTLAAMSEVTGLSLTVLSKILGVIFSLIPMFAFYALIKNRAIALAGATIGGLSPWIFNHVTHFTAPSLAAVFISFTVVMLFRLLDEPSAVNLGVLYILTVVLTFSDVLFSFIWIMFLLGFTVFMFILRQKGDPARAFIVLLLVISGLLWSVWYLAPPNSNGLVGLFVSIGRQVFVAFKVSAGAVQPTGTRSSELTAIEYAAFFAVGLYSIISLVYFRRSRPLYSSMIAGAAFAALTTAIPWLAGFANGTDLFSRSTLIFQLGVASVLAVLLTVQLKKPRAWTILVGVILISLVASNALLYGVEPYRYDSSTPMSVQDTRFNLEGWYYGSASFCEYAQTSQAWGVLMGVSFFPCLTTYDQLVPSVSTSGPVVSASDLLNLTQVIGSGQFVILRQSIQQVPEWPQKLPASPDSIFMRYDVVLESGDVVLIYT